MMKQNFRKLMSRNCKNKNLNTNKKILKDKKKIQNLVNKYKKPFYMNIKKKLMLQKIKHKNIKQLVTINLKIMKIMKNKDNITKKI